MYDFKYCIWACLESGHPWNSHNSACRQGLHITINSNLDTLDTAITAFNDIINYKNNIKIGLDAINPVVNRRGDFNAVYFPAYLVYRAPKPTWWPNDAHMSFYYSYGRSLRFTELTYVQKCIYKNAFGILNNFKLVRCTGHFNKHWLVIREHKIF